MKVQYLNKRKIHVVLLRRFLWYISDYEHCWGAIQEYNSQGQRHNQILRPTSIAAKVLLKID